MKPGYGGVSPTHPDDETEPTRQGKPNTGIKGAHVSRGCGYRNPKGVGFRITGAFNNEANFAEFPWTVAIMREEKVREKITRVYACGGSLIHKRVVLTGAHCVFGYLSFFFFFPHLRLPKNFFCFSNHLTETTFPPRIARKTLFLPHAGA